MASNLRATLEQQKFNVHFDLADTPYKALENIGTGAYGVVCSALDTRKGYNVAIKKISNALTNPTVARRTLREITMLKRFNHPNIIAIKDMFCRGGSLGTDVYIVLDLMESDLHQIIYSKQELSKRHIEYFLYQLLLGLRFMHASNIIHRDLKPSNLMVNSDCCLKIGDFGMARTDSNAGTGHAFMTQYVATRWYRAPELLFSLLEYSNAVDIWSAGCIFAEMIMRRQLFPGRDHLNQLKLIVCYLGTPPKEVMDKVQSEIVQRIILGLGQKLPLPWSSILPKATPDALDLITKMMHLAPWERITAADGLKHEFLAEFYDPVTDSRGISKAPLLRDVEEIGKGQLGEAILQEVEWFRDRNNRDSQECTPAAATGKSDPDLKPCVETITAATRATVTNSDVEMLSAKLGSALQFDKTQTNEIRTIAAESDRTSKEQVRNALLQVLEAKKQNAKTQQKEAPPPKVSVAVTAQARHQEKLDKRRKRFEKREERERKLKELDASEGTSLSHDDRSLLDRWKRLHGAAALYQDIDELEPTLQYDQIAPAEGGTHAATTEAVSLDDAVIEAPALPAEHPYAIGLEQIGDIISQALPSFGSSAGCVSARDKCDSAQLMDDWRAALGDLRPEELQDLEMEVAMGSPTTHL